MDPDSQDEEFLNAITQHEEAEYGQAVLDNEVNGYELKEAA